jgi:hypothetical protein
MGWECRKYEEENKCLQNFCRKTQRERVNGLWRFKHGLEFSTQVDLRIWSEIVDWIKLIQGKAQMKAFANMVMNLWVSLKQIFS